MNAGRLGEFLDRITAEVDAAVLEVADARCWLEVRRRVDPRA